MNVVGSSHRGVVHLPICDRRRDDGWSSSHVVFCPSAGWVNMLDCLGCTRYIGLACDTETAEAFIECSPS